MSDQPRFTYGGQAVIEGVMIRGRSHFGLAVRRLDGSIENYREPLNTLYTGKIRKIPLLRGMVVLAETLLLGMKALHRSASMAMRDQQPAGRAQPEEAPGWVLGTTMAASVGLGIMVFFVLPLMIVRATDPHVPSALASNIIEGMLRLVILVAYIWGISYMRDIKRVFAYHGAEHMAVHAYEAGLRLTINNVRKFGTPHPRCGTAFLLTVVLVSIIVFALLGRPPMEWRIASRILLLPVIAGISYEVIRFSGAHQRQWIGQLIARPGLLLQRLTTRPPDDSQIEVAICAMETAIAADEGREYAPDFPARPAQTTVRSSDGPLPEQSGGPPPGIT